MHGARGLPQPLIALNAIIHRADLFDREVGRV